MIVRDSNTYAYRFEAPKRKDGTEIDRSIINRMIVTFDTEPKIKKDLEWSEVNNCYILRLTQEDTKRMGGGNIVEFDAKIVFIDGSVRSGEILSLDVVAQVNTDIEEVNIADIESLRAESGNSAISSYLEDNNYQYEETDEIPITENLTQEEEI